MVHATQCMTRSVWHDHLHMKYSHIFELFEWASLNEWTTRGEKRGTEQADVNNNKICNPIRSSVSKKGDRKRIMGIWMEDEIIVIYELRSRYPINNNDYNTKCNASFHPNETLSSFAPKTLPKIGTSPTTYTYIYIFPWPFQQNKQTPIGSSPLSSSSYISSPADTTVNRPHKTNPRMGTYL